MYRVYLEQIVKLIAAIRPNIPAAGQRLADMDYCLTMTKSASTKWGAIFSQKKKIKPSTENVTFVEIPKGKKNYDRNGISGLSQNLQRRNLSCRCS